MSLHSFGLTPFFPSSNIPPAFEIEGTISRQQNLLSMRLNLIGNRADLLLPSPAVTPLRKDNLWQTTCFELFLAEEDHANYWEFNLSPAGHWNVYSFADYRQNMQEEAAYNRLPFTIDTSHEKFSTAVEIPLANIIATEKPLEAAVCAVIQHRNKALSYWALTHYGTQPDFHRRESFTIKL